MAAPVVFLGIHYLEPLLNGGVGVMGRGAVMPPARSPSTIMGCTLVGSRLARNALSLCSGEALVSSTWYLNMSEAKEPLRSSSIFSSQVGIHIQ